MLSVLFGGLPIATVMKMKELTFAEEVFTVENSCPKVSVIVPVYNTERYLRECLDSIKNQTLTDIEIICVDDGSPDNCGKILDEYAANDSRFIVIHQDNKGIGASRNCGLEKSTGEYITFVDSDDYLQLDAYETAYNSAKKDDADILQFQVQKFQDGEDARVIENNDYSEGYFVDNKDYFFEGKGRSNGTCWIWLKLFKSDFVKSNKVKFIEDIVPADDNCFSWMTAARAKIIKIIPTKLYNHRYRPDSTGALVIPGAQYFINNYKMIKYIYDDCKSIGFLAGEEHLLIDRLIRWSFCRGDIALKYAQEVLD